MGILVTPQIRIPEAELEITYVRSSGPGGQNVNKVNSKAVLRWSLAASAGVSEELRARLMARLGHRLTREGELIVASDRYRDQGRNREDCIEKLRAILAEAAFVPKKRRETRPSRGSEIRAREAKQRDSRKKRMRGRVGRED